MTLTKANDKELDFSLAKSSDIDPSMEQHMHELVVTQSDADHLSQVWTCYEHGKPSHAITISFARIH